MSSATITTALPLDMGQLEAWQLANIETSTSLGRLLADQREDFKGTPQQFGQEDVGAELGITQAYVSKLERGSIDVTIKKWPATRQYDLLSAYRFGNTDILRIATKFGLVELADLVRIKHLSPPHYRAGEGRSVRFAGVVSAGANGDNNKDEQNSLVGAPDWIADRYDLEEIFALEVSGDSMLSDDAREAIPEGSLVFFHANLKPEHGEIICVRLLESDKSVIKRYLPGDVYTVLESYNQEHPPIILSEEQPGQIEGVYLTHIPRTPRLR